MQARRQASQDGIIVSCVGMWCNNSFHSDDLGIRRRDHQIVAFQLCGAGKTMSARMGDIKLTARPVHRVGGDQHFGVASVQINVARLKLLTALLASFQTDQLAHDLS